MTEEERDTSEFDALEDTIEDEPIESEDEELYDEEPFDDDTSPDMVDDPEEAEIYAGKYRSVDDLENAYLEAQKTISTQNDYATLGRHIAPNFDKFQSWLDADNAPPPEPDPVWNPPHQIGEIQRAIDLMGTEAWETLPESDQIAAEEYLNYYNQKWRGWQTNPTQFAEELVSPMVEKMIGSRFQDLEAQFQAATFWREHGEELKDNIGEFQHLLRSGVPTEAAREIIQLRKNAAQGKSVRSEQAELQRKKDRLKGRVASRSQRGGGSVKAGRPSPTGKSFGEIFDDVSDSVGAAFDEETVL